MAHDVPRTLGGDLLVATVGEWARSWRADSPTAAGLVLHGLSSTLGGAVALTGALGPLDDPAATWGHVLVWDPLFLAWGLALGAGLWVGRERRPAPEGTDRRPEVLEVSRG